MTDEIVSAKLPHRRYNPLLDSWVLISPHRILRPWTGQIERPSEKISNLNNSEKNPLSPNAIRSNGIVNPDYKSIYVFDNDFPALLNQSDKLNYVSEEINEIGEFNFYRKQPAIGKCQVMCFHPNSNVTLATMQLNEVVQVINQWKKIVEELSQEYAWVQIFENRGEMMGCSNSHPHCQIWSTKYLPHIPSVKHDNLQKYYSKYGRSMLCDYIEKEMVSGERIVITNANWVCLVPYWAEWPFETMIITRDSKVRRLSDLSERAINDLAEMIQQLLHRYNNLFQCEFPYSMGWHGAPNNTVDYPSDGWVLHAMYYPPLLRSCSIRKFFVGFELLAETQRDLTAESAAQLLRNALT